MRIPVRIVLLGSTPAKKNSRVLTSVKGRAFSFPNKTYVKWHKVASSQIINVEQCLDIANVSLSFWWPDMRKRDITNATESVMDLLCDKKVIVDDWWGEVPRLELQSMGLDRENPRCEILIEFEDETDD